MISLEDLLICTRSLASCPKCKNEGGEVKSAISGYWVQCNYCSYTMPKTYDNPWEAVNDWNKLSKNEYQNKQAV